MSMNTKILILLLLGVSFLFLGCAKKGEQPETPGANASVGTGGAAANANDQQLAGLFNIDTDKPIGDEGLTTSMPHSDSNDSNSSD
ncbi:MAG: hypothetical protein PHF60_04270 [Candidatus ainarchaeum sp.]|nr:hypothetical protein [Candidatus ainarchaeum sp.]